MKSLVYLLVLVALCLAEPQATYTDRFDNVDFEQIINNKRLLAAYVKCILDKGRCTAEGKELKSHIKEALQNRCAKCTEVQKRGARRVIGHLINNEPEHWNDLRAKYDPAHVYTDKYETELRSFSS